jgi:hypothetical protein
MVFNQQPSLHHIRVFGCKAFAHVVGKGITKWDKKAVECILAGYNASSKNYLLFVPSEKRYIQQAKHVDFVETCMSRKEINTRDETPTMEDLQITVDTKQTIFKPLEGQHDGNHSDEQPDEDELVIDVTPVERAESWAEEVEREENETSNESSQLRRTTRNRRQAEKYQAGFKAMSAIQLTEPQS